MALVVGEPGDELRIEPIAAVGEDAVGGRHLQRRDRAGAECHRQVGRMLVRVEAEARDPLLRVRRADRLQDADRDHVLGLGESAAQRHRAVEGAVVVLRLPRLAAGHAGVEEQRRVIDDGGRRETLLERCRIDERLEARSRLAPRLRHVVELVLGVVEAPDHRQHGTGRWVERDEGALHLGQLRQRPVALGALDQPHHRTTADLRLRIALLGQPRGDRLEAVARDGDEFAVLQRGDDLLRARFEHHAGAQLVVVGVLHQRLGDARVDLLRIGRQIDVAFRASIDLAPLVIHDALAQGAIGDQLVRRVDRQIDVDAARVGGLAVLAEDELARRLGDVFGMHGHLGRRAVLQRLRLGRVVLGLADEAVVEHAIDDVLLALHRALRVGDRVVRRGRFRQPGQHRGLGDGHVLQRLAEVDLARRREAVGSLAEVDLVHVDLEDLLLGELALDLQR